MWNVWGKGDMRERDHLEYVGVDGRIVLKKIVKKQGGGRNWIGVAQNRDCMGRRKPTRCYTMFIELVICSTCFGHVYAHHQELATVLLV